MSQKQLFEAFSDEQQAEYEKRPCACTTRRTVKASQQKWKNYSAADKKTHRG